MDQSVMGYRTSTKQFSSFSVFHTKGQNDPHSDYHWLELPQVSFLSRQHTNTCLSRQNKCLSQQIFVAPKKIIGATKMIHVAAPANDTRLLSYIIKWIKLSWDTESQRNVSISSFNLFPTISPTKQSDLPPSVPITHLCH